LQALEHELERRRLPAARVGPSDVEGVTSRVDRVRARRVRVHAHQHPLIAAVAYTARQDQRLASPRELVYAPTDVQQDVERRCTKAAVEPLRATELVRLLAQEGADRDVRPARVARDRLQLVVAPCL